MLVTSGRPRIELVEPVEISLARAAGTYSIPIFEVPSFPAESNVCELSQVLGKMTEAVVGSGHSVEFRVGKTAGAEDLVKATMVHALPLWDIVGEAQADQGTAMASGAFYNAFLNASQVLYAQLVITGTVTAGKMRVRVFGAHPV